MSNKLDSIPKCEPYMGHRLGAPDPPAGRSLSASILRCLALVGVLVNAGLFVWVTANRLTFPFDLEVLEGWVADCALRVLRGQPLYAEPSFSFIPMMYGPVHPYVLAGLMKLLGTGYWVGRLLSVVSSLATCFFVGAMVGRRGGRTLGVMFGLLVLGLYAPTEYWMDLIRVDSLQMALTAGALWMVDRSSSRKSIVAAGLLLTASAFTKPTTGLLLIGFPIIIMLRDRRWRWDAVFSTWVPGVVILLMMCLLTGGWYWDFQVVYPARHQLLWKRAWHVFVDLGVRQYPMLLLGGICVYASRRLRRASWIRDPLLVSLLLVGPAGMLACLKHGGWINSYLVALPLLIAVAGMTAAHVQRTGTLGQSAVSVAVLLQSLLWIHNPGQLIPQRGAYQTVAQVRRALAGFQRPWFPQHGFVLSSRGGPIFCHEHGVRDLVRHRIPSDEFVRFVRSFAETGVDVIVSENRPGDHGLLTPFFANFVLGSTIDVDALSHGWWGLPTDRLYVYVPRDR